jgi:hypothetical protein
MKLKIQGNLLDCLNIIVKQIKNIHIYIFSQFFVRGRSGRDDMVVGFTTTYAIGAYHH